MNEKNQLGINSCFLNLDDPIKLFEIWMEKAKQTEPNDPNAVALGTSNKNNVPSIRMVLLKGFNKDGFPIGIQIIAKEKEDLKVLAFAKKYEEIYQYSKIKPNLS